MSNFKTLTPQANRQSLEAAKKEFYSRRYRISTFDSVFNLDKMNISLLGKLNQTRSLSKTTHSRKSAINPMLKNN